MSLDLRERTFGKLSVARTESDVWSTLTFWLCFCECGAQLVASETDLLKGEVIACDKCCKEQKSN